MNIVGERLFKVTNGSDTHKAIQQYIDLHSEAESAWTDFCKKYGAEQYFAANRIEGLIYERGQEPEGWINPKNVQISRAYRPSLRDKACSEAAEEFKALPSKPGSFKWLEMLGIPLHVGDKRSFKTPGFKRIGEAFYLTASEECGIPDDVKELSGSDAAALQAQHEKQEKSQ